jgi:hypothetical protein
LDTNKPPHWSARHDGLGVAGSGFAASILMSRPLYALWMAQYAALRAAVLRATVSNSTAAQLTSHIVQLGVHARRNSLLLPVCRAIVPENGILQQSNNRQPVPEKNEGCRVADAEDEIEGVSPLDRLFAHPQAYQVTPDSRGE